MRVFMSYAHDDRQTVNRIAADLRQAGADVWMDAGSLQPGDRWAEAIEAAIAGSDAMLVFISRASASSDWVRHELDAVLARQRSTGAKRVIPVRLDDTPASSMSPSLAALHWADFADSYASGLDALVRGLGLGADQAKNVSTAPTGPSLTEVLGSSDMRSLVAEIVAEVLRSASLPPDGSDATVRNGGSDESLAFVVIAFSPDMEYAFEAIDTACSAVGLKAMRVKDVIGDYRITEKVETLIRAARIVICDLTHERPNVYFELGFARGLGKQVVTVARKGSEVHFDVKDWTYIPYEDSRPLERALRVQLEAMLGEPGCD